jgi:hypothetical protein
MSFLYFTSCFTREFVAIGRIYGEEKPAVAVAVLRRVFWVFPPCFSAESVKRDFSEDGPALGDLWLNCESLE